MAKGNNNIRNKKPHSSKPYDVSNSFVKKVTSGVSSLLPQTSWLSRWFASTSTSEENAPSTSNDGQDRIDDQASHSPPTKRARIPLNRPFPANSFRVSSPLDRGETHPWPSESVASPIPNVFADSAVAGPSGLSRSPVASAPFQPSSTPSEGLEGKINGDGGSDSSESTSGCSSLAPQRTTSGTTPTHRAFDNKMSNHTSYSLFPAATHKLSPSINSSLSRRQPSFNVSSFGSPKLDSSKLSRESSLNSPFYIGRTMYGGASAYRRPRQGAASESFLSSSRRGGVSVRPVNEKTQHGASAEVSMSQTARRILEALEQFSSPVSEARRMPLPPQPALSAKRKRPLESSSTSPTKSSLAPAAAINPLTIPMPPERLRLHRLQDATEAARRIASSVSSSNNKYTLRSGDDGSQRAGAGKVTKSKPLDEVEQPLPVNLPHVSLPITTLPSFELFKMPVQSSTNGDSRTNTSQLTTSDKENSDKVEVKNNISCAVSSSSAHTSGHVDSAAAATSIGMKPINFMYVKNSPNEPNFKIKADCNILVEKYARNNEVSSAGILNELSKSNAKSVSFSGTDLHHINNPINTKGKVEIANNEHSSGMAKSSAVSSYMVKGAQFSKLSADSDKSPVTNDFVFSTPTVISSSKSRETTECKMRNFDFCKPEVLDSSNYSLKIKRNEPNGFRKLPSNTKVDDVQESIMLNAGSKEVSENQNIYQSNEYKSKGSFVPKARATVGKQNSGWGTKYSSPDTWECSSCLVRNKNNVKVCVCCGNNQPTTSASVSKDTDNKDGNVQVKSSTLISSGWGQKFAPQSGTWECSTCLVRNKVNDTSCVACTTPKCKVNKSEPAATSSLLSPITTTTTTTTAAAGDWGTQFKLTASQWECSTCLVRNDDKNEKCISCTTPRNVSSNKKSDASTSVDSKVSSEWGQKFKKPSSNWECPVCMIQNKNSDLKCAACQEPKPGIDTNRSSTGGSIKFNFEIPPGASNFKFGIDKADLKQSATTSAMFEGSNKLQTASSTGFTFGVTSSDPKMPSGIKFGVSPVEPSSASCGKPDLNVESNVTSTSVPTVPSLTSGLNTQVSQKSLPQPETSKSHAFSFGVVANSAYAPVSESIGEPKQVAKKSGIDPSCKDLNFTASPASPAISNSGELEKKEPAFGSQLQKGELKITNEIKSGFNFATPSAPTVTSSLPTTTIPSTSVSTTKPTAFSFSSNSSAVIPSSNVTTTTSTTSSVSTPISSSGIFSFGNNSAPFKPTATSAPLFPFGGSGVQTTSSGFFGTTQSGQFKSSGENLFVNKPVTSTVPVFGSSSASSKPSFGCTTTVSSTTTTTTTTAATTAAAAATTTTTTTSINSTLSVTSNNSTNNTSATVFAAPTTTTPAVAFASGIIKPAFTSVTSGFGAVTTAVVANVSTSVTTVCNNTNPTASFAIPTTTVSFAVPTTSNFSSGSTSTFGNPVTPSGFGLTTSSASIPTTTSTPSFANPTPSTFGAAAASGNSFAAANATQSFNTTTSNVFGSSNSPSFGSTSAFGTAATSSNFGSGFGSAITTAATFGTPAPSVSTTSTTPSLPSFGGFSSAKQGLFLFGSNPTSTAQSSNFSFNVPSQASGNQPAPSGTGAFSFGSGAASSATNVTTSTNTTSTPTATAAVAPAPASTFGAFSFTGAASAGSPSAPSLFGNTPTAGAAAPLFGAPAMPSSTPAAPTFGSGSATNNNVFSPAFNFPSGGSQQPFSFGSGAQGGTVPAAGSSGFTFGQGQPSTQSQSQPLQFNPNVRPNFNFSGGGTPQFTASGQSSTPTAQRRVKKAVRRSIR